MGVGRQAGRQAGWKRARKRKTRVGWEGERMVAVEGPPEGVWRKAPARFHGHRVYTPPLPRKEGYISHSNAPVPPLVTPSRSVTVRSPRPAAHFRLLRARNPLPLSLSFSPLSLPLPPLRITKSRTRIPTTMPRSRYASSTRWLFAAYRHVFCHRVLFNAASSSFLFPSRRSLTQLNRLL